MADPQPDEAPPYAGLLVVAIEQAVAAPYATRQLADLGARVIKIERPDGGDFARHYDQRAHGLSSHFVWLNRGKQSLALDLKAASTPAVLDNLLAGADVFVQNLKPGACARLGLAGEDLRQRFPRLIVCEISGYGDGGPYRDKKAYDLLVQCETGLVNITGTPQTPAKAGIACADIAAGSQAFSGIQAALFRRAQYGQGALLKVSLFDALAEWMSYPVYYAMQDGQSPRRSGAHHATIAPYGPFAAGDGQVFLAVQNEREWRRLCAEALAQPDLAELPDFASNEQRVANRTALHQAITAITGKLDAHELSRRLDEAGIANALLRDPAHFWSHPQISSRGRLTTINSETGKLPALLPAVTSSDYNCVMGDIPALGQHTQEILAEFGRRD